MPDLNVIHIAIIAAMTVAGVIVGWVLRGNRSKDEKAAISAGWLEQINAQRVEHDRLTEQNKALMERMSAGKTSGLCLTITQLGARPSILCSYCNTRREIF